MNEPAQKMELLRKIAALKLGALGEPGTVSFGMLKAICEHTGQALEHTMETGCGRTTLLFSNLSRHHDVFALEQSSMDRIQSHELMGRARIRFVEGPTQRTLPPHVFDCLYDAILLDGPHAYPFPELEYFFTYRQLKPGGLLIVDDIDIASIQHMYRVLREDDMFEDLGVWGGAAFLRRTDRPAFDAYGDGWWLQAYNKKRYPVRLRAWIMMKVAAMIPASVKRYLNRCMQRA